MAMELPPINMEDFTKWKSGNAVIQVCLSPLPREWFKYELNMMEAYD